MSEIFEISDNKIDKNFSFIISLLKRIFPFSRESFLKNQKNFLAGIDTGPGERGGTLPNR